VTGVQTCALPISRFVLQQQAGSLISGTFGEASVPNVMQNMRLHAADLMMERLDRCVFQYLDRDQTSVGAFFERLADLTGSVWSHWSPTRDSWLPPRRFDVTARPIPTTIRSLARPGASWDEVGLPGELWGLVQTEILKGVLHDVTQNRDTEDGGKPPINRLIA